MIKIFDMKNRTEEELLNEIVQYFKIYIFENHINASLAVHSKLKSYNINPIIVKYLSKILEENYSPEGVAKALFYPRAVSYTHLDVYKRQNRISLALLKRINP